MTSIYQTLTNDASVLAITDQIFREEVDQDTLPPFVKIEFITGNPENGFDGVIPGLQSRYGISCFGDDEQQSNELYLACFNALAPVSNIFNINAIGAKDPSGEAYLSQFDVSIWT